MNIFKLFFCLLCVLSDLIPVKEPSEIYSEDKQIMRDNNNQNKKNLFRPLGYGTLTGLSLVGLQYKFPVFFEKYTQRLPNLIKGNYKKLFLIGLLTGAGLYTATSWIIKKLKTNQEDKNDNYGSPKLSDEQRPIIEETDQKPIPKIARISLIMPGYFQPYIRSIEKSFFESSFFSVCSAVASFDFASVDKIFLWCGSRKQKFRSIMANFFKTSQLVARVFVMPDTQEIREEFEELVKTEHNGDLLDRYCDQKNQEQEGDQGILDCCYILPIDKETPTVIDTEELNNRTIDKCRFELNKKIDKTALEIASVEFINYKNPQFEHLNKF